MGEAIDGRYRLGDMLGQGGMGAVWRARDLLLDRDVAVKRLLLTGLSGDDEAMQRFAREAKLTARIAHPSVPAVHDWGTDGGPHAPGPYLVMELVRGKDLHRLLKEGRGFSAAEAADITVQIADALVHAHHRDVVHRDLKPSNVMLTEDGRVKVMDFGIAAAVRPGASDPRITGTGGMPGTPGFISPEQIQGAQATPRSDLYALGCLLYEVLTGKPPFTAESPWSLMSLHVREPAPSVAESRSDLPGELVALVARLLLKEPENRPSTAEVRALARRCAATAHAPAPAPAPTLVEAPAPVPAPVPGTAVAPTVTAPGVRAPAFLPRTEPGAPASPRTARIPAPAGLLDPQQRHSPSAPPRLAGPVGEAVSVSDRLRHCQDLFDGERFSDAYAAFHRLGAELRRGRPKADRDVLACRAGVAACLAMLGKSAEALADFDALLSVQEHVFGTTGREPLDTRFRIAELRAAMGQTRAARELLADLRDRQAAVLADDDERHTRVIGLLRRLDRVLGTA
ncbi:serine/threonine-protein kinase [Streptomyces sp. NPDC035033]|uniref:serine/threonine-protein kinase n=1 Tax=Streptomyces sp. NPDC035033 TaxID=3155368 RepID=UPI003408246F